MEYWSVTPEGVATVVGTAVTFDWIVVESVDNPFPIQKSKVLKGYTTESQL